MFGNPAAERTAIEQTYEDTAAISRTEPVTGENSITRAVPAVVYERVICALSYSGSDSSQQTKAQNEIEYDAVVFAAPELTVLPGDKIALRRFGRTDLNGRMLNFVVVGRPALYATHQEICVKEVALA